MSTMEALKQKLHEKGLWAMIVQFIKFSIVGVSNTLISLGTYWLCLNVFHWHYQVCNVVAFVISVTNAYYWNQRYVFAKEGKRSFGAHLKAYSKAFLSYGSTFLLSIALLALWVEVCHIDKNIAPVINLVITIPLNFVLNRYWAFR
jgi:putative flippase GtrA